MTVGRGEIADRPICECPKCGRQHRLLSATTPPRAISGALEDARHEASALISEARKIYEGHKGDGAWLAMEQAYFKKITALILSLLPASDSALREEIARMRKALEPFARFANLYADQEDDNFQVWKDASEVKITLGMLRRAAAECSASPLPVGESVRSCPKCSSRNVANIGNGISCERCGYIQTVGEAEPASDPGLPAASDELDGDTARLVQDFSIALAAKLARAEQKYGYTNGWLTQDWESECREHLLDHLQKGDPLDVAAYAAFMWRRGWSTSPLPTERDRTIEED